MINTFMAQLNGYINSTSDTVPIVPRPVTQYSPNGISRITPKESRPYAKAAYAAWVAGGMALPWDGVYTDHEGPQDLTYGNEV